MLRDDLEAFAPRIDRPLIIEFVNFLHERGYSARLTYGFWDFEVFRDADEPVLAIKTVRNAPTESQITKLVTDETPAKVLLVDGPNPRAHQVLEQAPFLAATGTGVFVRAHGWVILPGTPNLEHAANVRLRLAPRWQEQPDGSFLKACSVCGEMLPPDAYYRAAYPTLKDPYRHQCKACYRAGQKERHAQKQAD